MKTRKGNRWKWLFLLLFGCNVFVLSYIAWKLVFLPTEQIILEEPKEKSTVFFNVSTNKEALHTFVNNYLEDLGNQPLPYRVNLTDSVEVIGNVLVFSKEIQFLLKLEPQVMDNGDLLLSLSSIRLGQLQLPVQLVLTSMKDLYSLPDWVAIDPNRQEIYVAVTKIRPKNGTTLAVQSFDLNKDKIMFKLFMPTEN